MPIPGTTQVAAKIAPTALTDTYSTHNSIWGEGGWQEVADITARDAITTNRRHQGMAVWVVGSQKMYVLRTGVTNSDWVEFQEGVDNIVQRTLNYGASIEPIIPTDNFKTNGKMISPNAYHAIEVLGSFNDGTYTYNSGQYATAFFNDNLGNTRVKINTSVESNTLLLTNNLSDTVNSLSSNVSFDNVFNPICKITRGLKDNDVSIAVKLGDASNTAYTTQNKTIIGSTNENAKDISLLERIYKGGDNLFFNNNLLNAASTENSCPIFSLIKTPSEIVTTDHIVTVVNSDGAKIMASYLFNRDLAKIAIESGVWIDKTFCYVSDGNTVNTELVKSIFQIKGVPTLDTCSTTGTGTTRTCTIVHGSQSFTPTDDNVNAILAGRVQTPKGSYQIVSFISSSVVTISVPLNYVNETNVSFKIWRYLFFIDVANIKNTTLKEITTFSNTNPQYALEENDSLGVLVFGRTTSLSVVSIHVYIDGYYAYSHIETPRLIPLKSRFYEAAGQDQKDPYIGKIINSNTPFNINFGVPNDAENVISAFLVIDPDSTISAVDMDLLVNYTNTPNGARNEYTASDLTSTYDFVANTIQYIPFFSLLTNAQHGTRGGLQLKINSLPISIYVYGILILYK